MLKIQDLQEILKLITPLCKMASLDIKGTLRPIFYIDINTHINRK